MSTDTYASRDTATVHTEQVVESIDETIRVYFPHAHFYPLPSQLFVPNWMLRMIVDGQIRKEEEALWYPNVTNWRWQPRTFDQMLTDDRPWRLGYALLEGEFLRYHPSKEEGGGPLTYVITDDVIEVRCEGELLPDAYWRRRIIWPD